jgi:hypothetical protein
VTGDRRGHRQLDPALTTEPRHGRGPAQAAARIGFTAAGTAERADDGPHRYALALAAASKRADPGG